MREMWMKKHLFAADLFTTPTRFMVEHYVTWGLDRTRILHVTNGQRDYAAAATSPADTHTRHNRFGFFGQLVDVKGVWLLLEAVQILRAEGFEAFSIEINGDNLKYASAARRAEFEAFLAAEAERPWAERRVVFNGSYSVDQLPQRMARIDWVIVPSVWWEIFGLVISEAMMFRKPIISCNVGGPGERVILGRDGLHFGIGDAASLASSIRQACEEGLHARLAASMTSPPSRDAMVTGFRELAYSA
jgi:glycosyltransferase involved in cell wall biosynthesis